MTMRANVRAYEAALLDSSSPRLSPIDRLAEHMAEGCPSVIEAARRMGVSFTTADANWRKICRSLGEQAE